jgi:hypothetical protein
MSRWISLPTVTEVPVVGPIVAALLIGHTRVIARFPTTGHYASFNGKAPPRRPRGRSWGTGSPRPGQAPWRGTPELAVATSAGDANCGGSARWSYSVRRPATSGRTVVAKRPSLSRHLRVTAVLPGVDQRREGLAASRHQHPQRSSRRRSADDRASLTRRCCRSRCARDLGTAGLGMAHLDSPHPAVPRRGKITRRLVLRISRSSARPSPEVGNVVIRSRGHSDAHTPQTKG